MAAYGIEPRAMATCYYDLNLPMEKIPRSMWDAQNFAYRIARWAEERVPDSV